MNFAAISIAANGWKLEHGTSANTTPCAAVAVRETTVIAAWTDTDGVDLVAYFGIASQDLLVTDPLLIIPGGKKSASITLTSGSVALIMPA